MQGGGRNRPDAAARGTTMETDIDAASDRLAADPSITDYDFWRSLKNVNNRIFEIANSNEPIPMEIIRWRAILRQAPSKRGA
jgi:hypothetical protein